MEITRNKLTDYQVLFDHFSGRIDEEQLTEHQIEKVHRIRACYGLLLSAKSTFFILGSLMRTFNLSQSQSYRDLRLTEKLFGEVRKSNKAIKRQIAENMAKETYRMAKADGDFRGMNSATKNFIDATGCNIDDPELPDFEKIQPSVNVIMVDESLIRKLKDNLRSGPVERTRDNYAEYEEIAEDSQSGGQSGDRATD